MSKTECKQEISNNIEIYFFTNYGAVRSNNEDSLLIGELLISDTSMEESGFHHTQETNIICCVADGIGGAEKGEVASNLVLSAIRDQAARIKDKESLISSLAEGKEDLEQYVQEHPEAADLGCTLAGICIMGDTALAYNAGDCRVYRINGVYVITSYSIHYTKLYDFHTQPQVRGL